jgi:hypothetical protein
MGSPVFDLRELAKATKYEDGYDKDTQLIK